MVDEYSIGVDVGGTKIAIGLISEKRGLIASQRIASGFGMDIDQWLLDVNDGITQLCNEIGFDAIRAIGVGFAGQIDPETGEVKTSPNIGWRNVKVKDRLQDATGKPVTVVNDVQSASWGEWMHGAGVGTTNMVCAFVGTGVGGGIIIDGGLYKGSSGSAGEIGHMTLERGGRVCTCGGKGCLEAYAGGWAIALRAQEAVAQDPVGGKVLLGLVDSDVRKLTAKEVSKAAHSGDSFALDLVEVIGNDLGVGIANVANLFNPEIIVLGGGVVDGLPWLIDFVAREIREGALASSVLASSAESLNIVSAKLANDAPIIGAGLLALQHMRTKYPL
ncbi:MAG: ROK family protein [Chloroflexota bacterium]|nr:ROK family protein [Chloroflexota bacterium]